MSVNKSNDEKSLVKIIKTITNSGLDSIDPSLWENIRGLFKKCPQLIDKAFDALIIEFRKPHAQVRLSAMMLCNELFQRSHNFRMNVINKFEEILELTAGVNPNKVLPPPRDAADKLKALALRTVLDWKMKFAIKYPAILDYFHFLERCKNIDFVAVQRDIEADAEAKAEREREQERVRRLMFDSFIEEFNDKEADIEELINVINNSTSLLVPTPDNFFLEHVEDAAPVSESNHGEDFDMRLFGLRSSYNLEIKINPDSKLRVVRNDENAAVLDSLRESVKVAKKRYITLVAKWDDNVKKYSEDSSYIKKVQDLKTRLDACIKKYKDLDIQGCDDDDSDDDADMIEVVKEGYEAEVLPIVQEKLKPVEPKPGPSNAAEDLPKSAQQEPSKQNSAIQPGPSSSRKERLLAVAPKLPYDVDLYHWEDEDLKVPNLVSVHMGNSKFWGGSDAGDVSEIPNPEGIDALRSRVIEFSGKFEPVERSCRAPLPSGKLCPRRDRFRCPFHGKIVPRDKTGKCENPEYEPKSEPSTSKETPAPVPDWQDPELLAQLKASTGIDLKMPEKRKKGLKKKKPALGEQVREMVKTRNFPGIADIGILKNNPKARLKKKIFNRSAVKRVAEACNKLDRRKFIDKFGDQFNYL